MVRTECCTRKLSKQGDNVLASNVASLQEVGMSFQWTLGALKSPIRSRFYVGITLKGYLSLKVDGGAVY